MFQFAGFAPLAGCHAFSMAGCPIRTPADRSSCAAPRGFSQLIASFVASGSLGIPHAPLLGLSPCLYIAFFALLIVRVLSQGAPYGAPCPNMSMNSSFRCEILDFRLEIKKSNA